MTTNLREQQHTRIQAVLAGHAHDIPWRCKYVERWLKRGVDVLLAVLLLVILSPLMVVISFLVRATSKGPIFFLQTRLGLHGIPFRMIKFRSMIAEQPDGSAKGSGEVTADDQRLTPIGGWLRAWRLDELPQLLHVLSGKMSLVGPRPDIYANLPFYTEELLLRFAMPPGCTAWPFARGAFKHNWIARQQINADYIRSWSFWIDIVIIFQTVIVLLSQKDTTPETREQIRRK